ncbi:MAG TPA: RsmD family RNA methyltransferase, partial [Citricoccus sp.]
MPRIIAGQAGGLQLASVPGDRTRPTTDRTREALFSWLAARGWLDGTAVADLFAGSGALGGEAASRGAARVLLVEKDRRAAGVCRTNA